VAQSEGLEFKPQYCKKRKRKKENEQWNDTVTEGGECSR
jgi:hypothetical protein